MRPRGRGRSLSLSISLSVSLVRALTAGCPRRACQLHFQYLVLSCPGYLVPGTGFGAWIKRLKVMKRQGGDTHTEREMQRKDTREILICGARESPFSPKLRPRLYAYSDGENASAD